MGHGIVLLSPALAIALVVVPPACGQVQEAARDSAEIQTTATASRMVRPNQAAITLTLSAIDTTPAGAGRRLALRADSVRRSMIALGIPRDSLITGSLWRWWPGRITVKMGDPRCAQLAPNGNCILQVRDTLYQANDAIEVRIGAIEKVGAVIDAALEMGITDLSTVRFSASDTRAAREEALREATANARAQASVMAEASGGHLGRLLILSTSADPIGRFGVNFDQIVSSASRQAEPVRTEVSPPSITVSVAVFGRWRFVPAS